jgi:hypothetical protein
MILILNEKELLRKSLEDGYIDEKKPSNTIRILAKYYFSINMDKEQVFDSINNFFGNNYKKYNYVKWQNAFDRIIKNVYKDNKFELLDINCVKITKNELERMKNLNNIKYEKLAFVLLVYAKIYNQMNKTDSGWVNIEQKHIFSDAKIVIKVKDQGLALHRLEELGMINASKMVDCTNIRVNYIDENSEVVLDVKDFRNYVYEYLKWKGENISSCQKCGILLSPTNNRHKYCKTCWKEKERELWKEASQKYREKIVIV